MKRRSFIKMGASLWAVAPLTSLGFPLLNPLTLKKSDFQSADPLQVLSGLSSFDFSSRDFNGDNIDRPHDILWNIDGYIAKKGGLPAISAHYRNIVVGGGMSGLLSQYFLTKEQESLLLEQDNVLGGNSRGEVYQNKAYSVGAAYVVVPDEGDDIETFFNETGLTEQFRHEEASEVAVFFKNKVVNGFWDSSTDPAAKAQFEKLNEILTDILENKYPDIPATEDSQMTRDELNALDSISFEQWLNENLGPQVHPHIKEFFQLYAWSSFSGSMEEISAAQFLNFIASELTGILALPGGNSKITSTIYSKLQTNANSQIQSGAFVMRVKVLDNGKVSVLYENAEGQLVQVTCDKCIQACPKYVSKRVTEGLPEDQLKAMSDVTHRGYIVANILLNTKISSPGYDLFNLKGTVPEAPRPLQPWDRTAIDMIFADWAAHDEGDSSILTIYRPLPFDGARQFLFNPVAHDKHRKQVLDDVAHLLPSLGLNNSNVAGIRLTRWGHSVPLSQKSWIARGLPERISQPVDDKIYFVNQDNWANPAFETCFAEAKTWTDAILNSQS
ncbi:NAD(P)/FAD-dependent oxidoreductase [Pseudobdellovibrio exovorus]|nr:NAD(P)/FAD-dependent oxidoreductase [Pseudobdellovibrio exovorus]